MVQLVGKNGRITAAQCRHQRHVGHETTAEQQGLRLGDMGLLPARKCSFHVFVHLHVAADQMRGTRAHAPARSAFGQRLDQGRMLRQTEIVIAAEGQQRLLLP